MLDTITYNYNMIFLLCVIPGVIIITMNTSVVLVIVMLLASQVSCSPIINFSWDTPRHFCGSQLANVLALICSKGYNFYPLNDGQYSIY